MAYDYTQFWDEKNVDPKHFPCDAADKAANALKFLGVQYDAQTTFDDGVEFRVDGTTGDIVAIWAQSKSLLYHRRGGVLVSA